MFKDEIYTHPSQLEVALTMATAKYNHAVKMQEKLKTIILDASNKVDVKGYDKTMREMQKKYNEVILEVENSKKKVIKLQKELETSISMYQNDDELFSHLEGVKATSLMNGYKSTKDKKSEILGKFIALEKIAETAKEVLLLEKNMAKKTKRKQSEAEELLKLMNMSPEQRLRYSRDNRIKTLKKTALGLGGISAVATFFFPPLAIVTVPALVTGGVGYALIKNGATKKGVKKASIGMSSPLKAMLQEYAYGKPQIANNTSGFDGGYAQDPYAQERG